MNAVVTGASRGIGKAIAAKFLAEGFNVVICSKNEQNLQQAVEELSQSFGGRISAFPCDVSSKADLQKFSQFLHDKWDAVDVLVNNAGVFLPGSLLEEEEGVLEQTIESNLYSAYRITRLLVDQIRKSRKGHIINICSTASIMAYPNGGSYALSKAGMLAFSRTLRAELAKESIKVTAVLPGATFTDSWAASGLPEERFMTAEDVADVVFDLYNVSERTVVEEVLLRPVLGDV